MRSKNKVLKISYVFILLAFIALEANSFFQTDGLFIIDNLSALIKRNLIYFNVSFYIFLVTIIYSNLKLSEKVDYNLSVNTLLVTAFPIFSIIYIQYKINSLICLRNIDKIDQFTKIFTCEVSEYVYFFELLSYLVYVFMSKITFYKYRNNYLNWLVYSIYFYFIIYNLQFDSKFYESVEVGYANLINFNGAVILIFLSIYFIFREKFKYSNVIVILAISFLILKSWSLAVMLTLLEFISIYKNQKKLQQIIEIFLIGTLIFNYFLLNLVFAGGTDQLDFLNEILSVGNIKIYFDQYLVLYNLILPALLSKLILNFSSIDFGYPFIMSLLNAVILIAYFMKLQFLKLTSNLITFFGIVGFGVYIQTNQSLVENSIFETNNVILSSWSFYQTYPARYLIFTLFSLVYLLFLKEKISLNLVYFILIILLLDNIFIGLTALLTLIITEMVFSEFFNFSNIQQLKIKILEQKNNFLLFPIALFIILFQINSGYLSHFRGGYADILYLSHSFRGFHFIVLLYLIILIIYLFKKAKFYTNFEILVLSKFTFFYSIFIFISYFYFLGRSFPGNLYFLLFNFGFLTILSFHLLQKESKLLFLAFPLVIFSYGIGEIKEVPKIDFSNINQANIISQNTPYEYVEIDKIQNPDRFLNKGPSLMLNKYGSIFATKNNLKNWFTPYINPKIYNNFQCEFIFKKIRSNEYEFIYLDSVLEDFNNSLCREKILYLVNTDYELVLSLKNTKVFKLN